MLRKKSLSRQSSETTCNCIEAPNVDSSSESLSEANYREMRDKEINVNTEQCCVSSIESMSESTSPNCSQKCCEVEQMSQLHFVKFQTKYIEKCLDFIKNHIVGNKESVKGNTIKVTGGGVCKYASCIKEKLGMV